VNVLFREAAAAELAAAIEYYEAIDSELALRFQVAVDNAVAQVVEHPESCQVVHSDLRRAPLLRFPHALYYRFHDGSTIVFVACIHPGRDHAIWMKRG
jgi:plasmid stabilization system protein ParE